MPILILILIALFVVIPGIRVVNQYERGVVQRLGRFRRIMEPGLHVIIPYIDTMRTVDVRTTPMDVPKQEVITKDNVTVNVDAVVYFRVIDAKKAVFETTNYAYATSTFAQTALRDVTGNFDLDELLSKRDKISSQIKEIVDTQTDKWGIDIESVKLQNIELPSDMKRAMAKQAEAERERRAAIISAEGEKALLLPLWLKLPTYWLKPRVASIFVLFKLSKKLVPTHPKRPSFFCLPTSLVA